MRAVCAVKTTEGAGSRPDPILESLLDLMSVLRDCGQDIARTADLPASTAFALSRMDDAMSMKGLAGRLGCEQSFATAIADELEAKGLARRTTDTRDRRVKILSLTHRGRTLRRRLSKQLSVRLPWSRVLNDRERATLQRLLTKLVKETHQ